MPNTPAAAGKGGLIRGLPRLPSIEFMRAVSSPQMYAPAPPPAQTRLLHDVDQLRGLHRERLRQHLVAAPLDPALVGSRVRVPEVLGEDDGFASVRLVRETHQECPMSNVQFSMSN